KFAPSAASLERTAALDSAGATKRRDLRGIGVSVVDVPPSGRAHAPAHPRGDGAVEVLEADGQLEPPEVLPSDPSFPQTYSVGGGAWGWYATHTTQAWDVTKGDPSVVIAVVDTGLKTIGLDDFGGQVVSGWNVVTGTSDTAAGAGNHGTYV